jgi:hypothetical protein
LYLGSIVETKMHLSVFAKIMQKWVDFAKFQKIQFDENFSFLQKCSKKLVNFLQKFSWNSCLFFAKIFAKTKKVDFRKNDCCKKKQKFRAKNLKCSWNLKFFSHRAVYFCSGCHCCNRKKDFKKLQNSYHLHHN